MDTVLTLFTEDLPPQSCLDNVAMILTAFRRMEKKAGNAGIRALGQMPGGAGVGALAALRTKLRDRGL